MNHWVKIFRDKAHWKLEWFASCYVQNGCKGAIKVSQINTVLCVSVCFQLEVSSHLKDHVLYSLRRVCFVVQIVPNHYFPLS